MSGGICVVWDEWCDMSGVRWVVRDEWCGTSGVRCEVRAEWCEMRSVRWVVREIGGVTWMTWGEWDEWRLWRPPGWRLSVARLPLWWPPGSQCGGCGGQRRQRAPQLRPAPLWRPPERSGDTRRNLSRGSECCACHADRGSFCARVGYYMMWCHVVWWCDSALICWSHSVRVCVI